MKSRRTVLPAVAAVAVLVIVVLRLVATHDTDSVKVPSESMEPTLDVHDRITINHDAYDSARPKIGDIVVHYPPKGAEGAEQCGERIPDTEMCSKPTPELAHVKFVKRIVAGPGDRVALQDGHVVLNGQRQDEPFIKPCEPGAQCTFAHAITVPPDHWYMLGDNRGESDDSRFWGPIPTRAIIGRVDDCGFMKISCSPR